MQISPWQKTVDFAKFLANLRSDWRFKKLQMLGWEFSTGKTITEKRKCSSEFAWDPFYHPVRPHLNQLTSILKAFECQQVWSEMSRVCRLHVAASTYMSVTFFAFVAHANENAV